MSDYVLNHDFMNCYRYGTYYNPANQHYNNLDNVGCDRCLIEGLTVCIGWTDIDLCLECTADLDDIYHNLDSTESDDL